MELEGLDRAMALAGQALAALLPLMVVVNAASPDSGRDVADALIEEFRLSGSAAEALKGVLSPDDREVSATIAGVALLMIFALSFTRALQGLCVRVWHLELMGLRGNAWGALWLIGFIALASLEAFVAVDLEGLPATLIALALATLLWLLTPWVLVGLRLPWRRLLPQALLTAAGLGAVSTSAVLYAPRIVSSAERDFGVFGEAFALLTLLFVLASILVVAAALGATLAESRRAEVSP